jgi:hypothetical protein
MYSVDTSHDFAAIDIQRTRNYNPFQIISKGGVPATLPAHRKRQVGSPPHESWLNYSLFSIILLKTK